jgi:MFS family permease
VILSDLVPLKRRGTFQGYMNIVFSTGTSLGAPLGGIMADVFGWRWSFGIQIPLILISTSIVAFQFHLPDREISAEPMKTKLSRIDFWGALLLVLALPSFRADIDVLCVDIDSRVEFRW